jgi:hypothetical protein
MEMRTREDIEEYVSMKLTDALSEIECRKGQPFEGELCDAIYYIEDALDYVKLLDRDDYETDEDSDE